MNEKNYRNILVAVSGLTPQIITETLYGLVVEKKRPIHKVHVITTTTGKRKIDELLLANGRGKLYTFADEYQLRAEDYVPDVHIIQDGNGRELDDIRTEEDNQIAADFIMNFVKKIAEDPSNRIIASVAGGRKTMSVYLGYAMQLFGRPGDMITHVLIQPDILESNPEFFYVPANVSSLKIKKRKKDCTFEEIECSIETISIDLAEIPFIRLREIYPQNKWPEFSSFTDLVSLTQKELDKAIFQPKLSINLKEKEVVIESKEEESLEIKLKPQEITFYYFMGQHRYFLNNEEQIKKYAGKFLEIYEKYFPQKKLKESSFTKEKVQSLRCKINKKLATKIKDPRILNLIQINSKQKNNLGVIYSIAIDIDNIYLNPPLINNSSSSNHQT